MPGSLQKCLSMNDVKNGGSEPTLISIIDIHRLRSAKHLAKSKLHGMIFFKKQEWRDFSTHFSIE